MSKDQTQRAPKDQWDFRVTQDLLVTLVLQDVQNILNVLGLKDVKGRKACQGPKELKEDMESKGNWETSVDCAIYQRRNLVLEEFLGTLVNKDLQDLMDDKAIQDHRVIRVCLVHLVLRDTMAVQEHQGLKGPKEIVAL